MNKENMLLMNFSFFVSGGVFLFIFVLVYFLFVGVICFVVEKVMVIVGIVFLFFFWVIFKDIE